MRSLIGMIVIFEIAVGDAQVSGDIASLSQLTSLKDLIFCFCIEVPSCVYVRVFVLVQVSGSGWIRFDRGRFMESSVPQGGC